MVSGDGIILDAFKRREQFNAIRRFMVIFLCGEVASFNISTGDHQDLYFFVMGTQLFVLIVSSLFLNEEYISQRRFLLIVSGLCTLIGIAYVTVYIVLVSNDIGNIRR